MLFYLALSKCIFQARRRLQRVRVDLHRALDECAGARLLLTVALHRQLAERRGRGKYFALIYVGRIRRARQHFLTRLERFFVHVLAARLQVAARVGRAQFHSRLREVIFRRLRELSDRLVAR